MRMNTISLLLINQPWFGLLISYEVISKDYASTRAFLKDYKHLQGIRFSLNFDFFLEVKNQMKEGKEELQLIKKNISGV